jgi:hypothetical protein
MQQHPHSSRPDTSSQPTAASQRSSFLGLRSVNVGLWKWTRQRRVFRQSPWHPVGHVHRREVMLKLEIDPAATFYKVSSYRSTYMWRQ